MRKSLIEYYQPTDAEFKDLWDKCVFVFDTNVLLDMYSYPDDVRDIYFTVLESIKNRIWIPFHVALEYQRNRTNRITSSNAVINKAYSAINNNAESLQQEIRTIELNKRNTGVTNLEELIQAIKEANEKLSQAVKVARDRCISIGLDDPIREKLSAILDGRVGEPIEKQDALDIMIADADKRYEDSVPPGFSDKKKGGHFIYRNVQYQNKYSDLVIWKQVLRHASESKISHIIFITGDNKEDWWQKEDGKTLGPHPGLIREAITDGGIAHLWIYTPDRFLQYAKMYLEAANVTDDAVGKVKEVSERPEDDVDNDVVVSFPSSKNECNAPARPLHQSELLISTENNTMNSVQNANTVDAQVVCKWVESTFNPSKVFVSYDFPDIVAYMDGDASGFDIKRIKLHRHFIVPPSVTHSLLRGYLETREQRLDFFYLILLIQKQDVNRLHSDIEIVNIKKSIDKIHSKYPVDGIILGCIDNGCFKMILKSVHETV